MLTKFYLAFSRSKGLVCVIARKKCLLVAAMVQLLDRFFLDKRLSIKTYQRSLKYENSFGIVYEASHSSKILKPKEK